MTAKKAETTNKPAPTKKPATNKVKTSIKPKPLFTAVEEVAAPAEKPLTGGEKYGLTAEVAEAILQAGMAVGAKSPARVVRKRLCDDAWKAAEAGYEPPPPTFPISNYWMQRHADNIEAFMRANDIDAVKNYEINGSNTYSKALRSYRDACITFLMRTPEISMKSAKHGKKAA